MFLYGSTDNLRPELRNAEINSGHDQRALMPLEGAFLAVRNCPAGDLYKYALICCGELQ
jgi:hypothetical protein